MSAENNKRILSVGLMGLGVGAGLLAGREVVKAHRQRVGVENPIPRPISRRKESLAGPSGVEQAEMPPEPVFEAPEIPQIPTAILQGTRDFRSGKTPGANETLDDFLKAHGESSSIEPGAAWGTATSVVEKKIEDFVRNTNEQVAQRVLQYGLEPKGDFQSPFGEDDNFTPQKARESLGALLWEGASESAINGQVERITLFEVRANGTEALERYLHLLGLPPLQVMYRKTPEELANEGLSGLANTDKEGASDFLRKVLELESPGQVVDIDSYASGVKNFCDEVNELNGDVDEIERFEEISEAEGKFRIVEISNQDYLDKALGNLVGAGIVVAENIIRAKPVGPEDNREKRPRAEGDGADAAVSPSEDGIGEEAVRVAPEFDFLTGERLSNGKAKRKEEKGPPKKSLLRRLVFNKGTGLVLLGAAVFGSGWIAKDLIDDPEGGRSEQVSAVQIGPVVEGLNQQIDKLSREIEEIKVLGEKTNRDLSNLSSDLQKFRQDTKENFERIEAKPIPVPPQVGMPKDGDQKPLPVSGPVEIPKDGDQKGQTPSGVTSGDLSPDQAKEALDLLDGKKDGKLTIEISIPQGANGVDTFDWGMGRRTGLFDPQDPAKDGAKRWRLTSAVIADQGKTPPVYSQVYDGDSFDLVIGDGSAKAFIDAKLTLPPVQTPTQPSTPEPVTPKPIPTPETRVIPTPEVVTSPPAAVPSVFNRFGDPPVFKPFDPPAVNRFAKPLPVIVPTPEPTITPSPTSEPTRVPGSDIDVGDPSTPTPSPTETPSGTPTPKPTETATPTPSPTPSPEPSPTPESSFVDCSPATQSAVINQPASFTAKGGWGNTGRYSWLAPDGNPADGEGRSFSTRYSTLGSKRVTVTSDPPAGVLGPSTLDDCLVDVTASPTPSPTPTLSPSPSPTPTMTSSQSDKTANLEVFSGEVAAGRDLHPKRIRTSLFAGLPPLVMGAVAWALWEKKNRPKKIKFLLEQEDEDDDDILKKFEVK